MSFEPFHNKVAAFILIDRNAEDSLNRNLLKVRLHFAGLMGTRKLAFFSGQEGCRRGCKGRTAWVPEKAALSYARNVQTAQLPQE